MTTKPALFCTLSPLTNLRCGCTLTNTKKVTRVFKIQMDKSQMREALKAIKDSLPKDITVTIKSEKDSSPRTITSIIKEITVGKGYKGSYTAKLETGDVISSMASEQVISMTINGVTYDKEQEKKVYNQKPAIDENAAKTLFTQFSALSKDDIIKITSTENRFNQTFKVLNAEIVHAPFKQCKITVQKADGNGPVAHFLSRRDSGIISKCEVQNMEEEEIVEEVAESTTITSEPEETEINL